MGKMSDNFGRALDFQIKRLEEHQVNVVKFAVRVTYEIIFQRWPRSTFYSVANHRINIGGSDVILVEPSKQPSKKGALAGKSQSVRTSQLQKLETLKPKKKGHTIVIGNAVSYAADVQHITGNGAAIYQQSANEAKTVISAGIGFVRF